MKKSSKGISLLELVLVIAIIATMMLLAIRYFALSRMELKTTQSVSLIQKISTASYQWLNSQSQLNFSGPALISMSQLVDANYLNTVDSLDPWGGSIVVSPGPGYPKYVQISLPNAPLAACNGLRQRLAKSSFQQITICTTSSGYYGSF